MKLKSILFLLLVTSKPSLLTSSGCPFLLWVLTARSSGSGSMSWFLQRGLHSDIEDRDLGLDYSVKIGWQKGNMTINDSRTYATTFSLGYSKAIAVIFTLSALTPWVRPAHGISGTRPLNPGASLFLFAWYRLYFDQWPGPLSVMLWHVMLTVPTAYTPYPKP